MKVSVIIPVYNASPFLDKSIQSALDQKQSGEVLLIDDRSTDDSLEICKKWERYDSRVKVFVNEGTKGAGAARNVGLHHATCEYIAFLDADDYYLKGRFDEDERQFSKTKSIEVISNSLKIVNNGDENKHLGINSTYVNYSTIGYRPSYSKICLNNFGDGNSFSIIGLTLKKEVFYKIGYFDESLKQCQDTDINVRLMLKTNIYSGNFDNPIVVYFRHNHNTTNNSSEAIYYRRRAAKKHFHLAIENHLRLKLKWRFFKNFMEYDYLWFCGKSHKFKKIYKIFLLPFFVFRIFSKTDPEYDKDRKIHLT